MNWTICPADPGADSLAATLGVPALVGQLLLNRGLADSTSARLFLDGAEELHEPSLLHHLDAAVTLLREAVRCQRPVVIYGDYDVDGVSGTAILYHALKVVGLEAHTFTPHRLHDGYGLHLRRLRELAERHTNPLIVTVDCGIAASAIVRAAQELRLTLVVTDHHEWGPAGPPPGQVVHPRLGEPPYPFPHLGGAGVAFKLAQGLLRSFKVEPPGDLYALACLGTIADVVPLRGENRRLAAIGLERLPETSIMGLRCLLEVCKLLDKPRLQADDIAFFVGPRLNAFGRLDDASLAVELLTTAQGERAEGLAKSADGLNAMRRQIERRVYREARDRVDPSKPAVVLHDASWDHGVVGVVAGKLAEELGKPVVLSSGSGATVSGSVRGVDGFDVHAALQQASPSLTSQGGHVAAGGFKAPVANLAALEKSIEQSAAALPARRAGGTLHLDAVARIEDIDRDLVEQVYRLAPFGRDNPAPLLLASRCRLTVPPRTMGAGGDHLSFTVGDGGGLAAARAVAFFMGGRLDELLACRGALDLVFTPSLNHWQGVTSVQLVVRDFRATPAF